MKKILLFLLLLLPFFVYAEDCNPSSISIVSMEQKNISGNTEIISEPSYENNNISLNLKMYDINDSVSYDMTIKNNSDEDFMISEDSFKTSSNHIEYTLTSKDGTNVVKANSTKEMVLGVIYKTEVNSSDYDNNVYNASNTLKLELSTGEKAKEMSIITTGNEVKNPNTKVNSLIVLCILLSVLTLIFIVKTNKGISLKIIILFLCIFTIPIAYAICKIEIKVESHIEIERKDYLFNRLVSYSSGTDACVTKYTGNVTDEVGKTVSATNVYFDKCPEQRNVIFGGFCWQVIRTTDTKGIKLIYNGEPVDGKCESTRSNHKGLSLTQTISRISDGNYIFGSSYTYDNVTNTFTLIDTNYAIESSSPEEDFMHKYTCFNYEAGPCQFLYYVDGYDSPTKLRYRQLKPEDQNYSVIGQSHYNDVRGLPEVGYMYNQIYTINSFHNNLGGYKYSNEFIYDSSTNTYTLSGSIKVQNSFTNFARDNDSHYTCFNTEGTCQEIYYVYTSWGNGAKYYTLSNGEGIEDLIHNELLADDINKENSHHKFLIDTWYEHNLSDYTNRIENNVYCNNREIKYLGGYDPNGDKGDSLQFISDSYNYDISDINLNNVRKDLSCSRELDQFSVSNNKAKLLYPIGLPTTEELFNLGTDDESDNLRASGVEYATITPMIDEMNGVVVGNGKISRRTMDSSYGVRPMISLKYNVFVESGTGSETDPWIVK